MSETTPDSCPACAIVRGERRPSGGVLLRGRHFVLHGLDGPTPVPGWLVLTGNRHTRAWYELSAEELERLGPVAAAVMRAQRDFLGAEHAYALALGDVLEHFHLHLVPRFLETPARLRGRGAFDAQPEDALPAAVLEEATHRLSRGLGALEL